MGTVLEYPAEADAQRACESLRMQANAESVRDLVTMRGLIDCYTEEVLRQSLNIPIGGATDEDARIGYSTAAGYRNSLRKYILPRWETYEVRDFEKPEVHASAEKWFRSLLRSVDTPDGLAPKSVRQVYAAMSQICKFGVKRGYLKFNPFTGSDKRIELPRGSTKRLKPPMQIDPSQFYLLVSNLDFSEKLAVSLAGWLGLRISEAFGLQWQDIDLELMIVSFWRGYSHGRISNLKNEASRADLPIPEEISEMLRTWYSQTTYDCPTD